ncbi:hypothetical protein O9G_002234 [Rozella allomycis CSF55]|uniref:Uncharacterized protein n=1 Tax=Rozella allomycis (strain CSF55) TaxID=988480 RepID=A0A075B1D8_ROZAC|nr:hypothetical protein O9G_002234 [Rozella allomycis CSF55]|eukprot:EPZ36168.1 hypothetical protein O9G_002234 [Rozella allomycis CSF55]
MKTGLSKNILSLKFMQKNETESEKKQNTSHMWTIKSKKLTNLANKTKVEYENSSLYFMKDDIYGRKSFNEFNPTIDSINPLNQKQLTSNQEIEKDISDEQVAEVLNSFKRPKNLIADKSEAKIKKMKF